MFAELFGLLPVPSKPELLFSLLMHMLRESKPCYLMLVYVTRTTIVDSSTVTLPSWAPPMGGIDVRIVDCFAVEKTAHDLHHAPLSLLSLRSKIFRAVNLPSCGGIVPAGA